MHTRPLFIHNYTVKADDGKWKGVYTRPVPPCLVPFPLVGCALQQTDPNDQDLLAFAIKSRVWLSLEQLKMIFMGRDWPLPKGTGKKGGRTKYDFAKTLVDRLFPGLSPEEKQQLISQLGAAQPKATKEEDECDSGMLEIISALDPENAIDAKGIRQQCFDRLAARKFAKDPDKVHPFGWAKMNFTPTDLKELLPPAACTTWIRRQPGLKTYVGFYDRSSSSI